nr:CHAP domain-containing protein [Tanticharoenia sakaeratensis]
MSLAEARPLHRTSHHAGGRHLVRMASARHIYGGHVIQCVAFAKAASEVELHGNAADWWYNANGVYARGQAPEAGSVLSFRATRRMPLGHVAVVTAVEDSRTIVIDQSHWAQRGISRNVHVVDVSPNNDWSAVRVALNGNQDAYGSIYPTHGFIYARPDDGSDPETAPHVVLASVRTAPTAVATHGAVDLSALRHPMTSTEVAEAPDDAFAVDAPNRNIR